MTTTAARGNDSLTVPLPPILRLPSSLGSLLRSTAQLPSLSSLVTQLAHNAIDAGATQVRISIHPESCAISCWDNGEGFHAGLLAPSTAADADAALDRYVTTKARSSITYGKRGEALASMAAIGMLHIETTLHGDCGSRHDGTRWTILKRGDRLLYSGPTDEAASMPSSSSQSHLLSATASLSRKGTTVTIRDIFSSLPLRRPLLSSRDSLAREVKACSQALAHVSLREQRVSFLLEVASASAGRTSVHLKAPACDSMLDRFAQLRFNVPPEACGTVYAKRRLLAAKSRHSSSTQQEQTMAPRLVVKGFFLFEGQESRGDQHVYLQGHRLPAGVELSDFWAQIGADQRYQHRNDHSDQTRRASSSGVHWQRRRINPSAAKAAAAIDDDPSVHAAISHTIMRGFKSSDLDSSANLAGPDGPKRYERRTGAATLRGSHPAYVFDIWLHLPAQGGGDVSSSNGGAGVVLDEEAIVSALCEEIRDVQRVHGLVRKAKKRPATASVATTTGKDDGTKRQAAKRPRTTTASHDALRLPTVFPSVKQVRPRAEMLGERSDDKPREAAAKSNADEAASTSSPAVPPGFVTYDDPLTKRSYLVDSRTGNSYPADGPLPGIAGESVVPHTGADQGSTTRPSKTTTSRSTGGVGRQNLRREWDATAPQATPPRWLEETLNEWTNPALPLQRAVDEEEGEEEALIHALPSLLPLLNGGGGGGGGEGASCGPVDSCPCCAGSAMKPAQQQRTKRQERNLPLAHVQLQSSYFSSRDASASASHRQGCHASSATHQQLLGNSDGRPFTVLKDQLVRARVVGQAAKKFIVCLVDLDGGGGRKGIICVDQHAADERVRLEDMLGEYVEGCRRREEKRKARRGAGQKEDGDDEEEGEDEVGPSYRLKAPLCIWLPVLEAQEVLQGLPATTTTTAASGDGSREVDEGLSATGRRLRYWGFGFARSSPSAIASTSTAPPPDHLPLVVTHVPRAVSDRLRREVATLTAVVRSFVLLPSTTTAMHASAEVRDIDDDAGMPTPATLTVTSSSSSSWMSALRHLPRRLVDLFKSRACRGAIMFNDALTQEQCERLVARWVGTDLPLICAHGRRSVVGLCGMTAGEGAEAEGGKRRRGTVRWERAQKLGAKVTRGDEGIEEA